MQLRNAISTLFARAVHTVIGMPFGKVPPEDLERLILDHLRSERVERRIREAVSQLPSDIRDGDEVCINFRISASLKGD